MQTADYSSVSSEFSINGAIKSLWIDEKLTKVLSKVSVEIPHEVTEIWRSFTSQKLHKSIGKWCIFLKKDITISLANNF